MILTRIKRGAARSYLLAKHKLHSTGQRTTRTNLRIVRNTFLKALVFRMLLLPIPVQLAPATAHAAGIDETEPPSTVRLSSSSTDALTFTPSSTLTVQSSSLQSITVGKSLAVAEQEEQARRAAEEAAKKQAEEEAARQAEQARIAAAEAAAKAAAEQAAEQARALASIASGSVEDIAHQMTAARFGEDNWQAMRAIIMRESGFNPGAYNVYSGACGIPQALPCSKLPQGLSTPVSGQIQWMLDYIAGRYGTPNNAWAFWLSHGNY